MAELKKKRIAEEGKRGKAGELGKKGRVEEGDATRDEPTGENLA